MKKASFVLVSIFLVLTAGFAITACESETGPDAPKRENGCIDLDCPFGDAAAPTNPDEEAGSPDGG